VVQVNELDEGFNLSSLLDLLLSHASSHLAGLSLDTDDQSVTEFQVLDRWRENFTLVPSSLARNNTAFLPLKRPAVTTTSLPGFKL
jgi:hypothetical protein